MKHLKSKPTLIKRKSIKRKSNKRKSIKRKSIKRKSVKIQQDPLIQQAKNNPIAEAKLLKLKKHFPKEYESAQKKTACIIKCSKKDKDNIKKKNVKGLLTILKCSSKCN